MDKMLWWNKKQEGKMEGNPQGEQEIAAAISEAMVDGLWIIDLQGKTINVNSAMAKMLGYENRAELIKKNPADVTANKSLEVTARTVQESLQGKSSAGEINMLKKDGKEIPVSIIAVAMQDINGKPTGAFAIMRDITESKKAGEKIKIFSQAIESAYDSFILVDMNGNVTYANGSAIKTFGYSYEEILKLNVSQFTLNPEDAGKIVEEIRNKGKWSGEVICTRKNKEIFSVILSNSLFVDDKGNPTGIMGIFRDITGRKQADESLKNEMAFRESTLNAISDIFYVFDRSGKFLSQREFPAC